MPTSVSLFVWLPEERAKWVEMRAKRDRAIRDMFGQWRRSRKAKLRAVQNHIQASSTNFGTQKAFSSLIRQVQGGPAILGPVLAAFAGDVHGRYGQAMDLMTELVRQGQKSGEIRGGDPRALAHLASVLTNEYVLTDVPLTREEFHAVFDGALSPRHIPLERP